MPKVNMTWCERQAVARIVLRQSNPPAIGWRDHEGPAIFWHGKPAIAGEIRVRQDQVLRATRTDTMRAHHLARLAEVVYAATQGATAYYVSRGLAVAGHRFPLRVFLLAAAAPVAVALVLAVMLRTRAQWVWWPAVAFALYVFVDGAYALIRVAHLPVSTRPPDGWLGFVAIGLRLLTQVVVVCGALLTLRQPSIVASPAA